jgi:hypothetical protein
MERPAEDGIISVATGNEVTAQRDQGKQGPRQRRMTRKEVQTRERARRTMELRRAAAEAGPMNSRRVYDLRINPELANQREAQEQAETAR